jgi:hypothetical protein
MKINEILTENTVDESVVDSVKNLGQNFASGLKGGANRRTKCTGKIY